MKKKPWNKKKIVGSKPPLTPEKVQLIRLRLKQGSKLRDRLLFSLAIDTALRGCDLVKLSIDDMLDHTGQPKEVITITQQKTQHKVSCAVSEESQDLLMTYLQENRKFAFGYLFTRTRGDTSQPITVNHYRWLIKEWLKLAGLDPYKYGSHSLRRTKTSLIYEKTGNLRACQKILGHSNITNTANYLGIEEKEALEIAKRFDI